MSCYYDKKGRGVRVKAMEAPGQLLIVSFNVRVRRMPLGFIVSGFLDPTTMTPKCNGRNTGKRPPGQESNLQ